MQTKCTDYYAFYFCCSCGHLLGHPSAGPAAACPLDHRTPGRMCGLVCVGGLGTRGEQEGSFPLRSVHLTHPVPTEMFSLQ